MPNIKVASGVRNNRGAASDQQQLMQKLLFPHGFHEELESNRGLPAAPSVEAQVPSLVRGLHSQCGKIRACLPQLGPVGSKLENYQKRVCFWLHHASVEGTDPLTSCHTEEASSVWPAASCWHQGLASPAVNVKLLVSAGLSDPCPLKNGDLLRAVIKPHQPK